MRSAGACTRGNLAAREANLTQSWERYTVGISGLGWRHLKLVFLCQNYFLAGIGTFFLNQHVKIISFPGNLAVSFVDVTFLHLKSCSALSVAHQNICCLSLCRTSCFLLHALAPGYCSSSGRLWNHLRDLGRQTTCLPLPLSGGWIRHSPANPLWGRSCMETCKPLFQEL